MFLTALWLAWVVFRQSGYEGLIILISSLMILLVAFLILRLSSVIAKRSSVALISASILFLIFFIPAENKNTRSYIDIGEKWSTERVNQLRDEKRNIY